MGSSATIRTIGDRRAIDPEDLGAAARWIRKSARRFARRIQPLYLHLGRPTVPSEEDLVGEIERQAAYVADGAWARQIEGVEAGIEVEHSVCAFPYLRFVVSQPTREAPSIITAEAKSGAFERRAAAQGNLKAAVALLDEVLEGGQTVFPTEELRGAWRDVKRCIAVEELPDI